MSKGNGKGNQPNLTKLKKKAMKNLQGGVVPEDKDGDGIPDGGCTPDPFKIV